ncbi:MAG: hypothetical protein CL840_10040 [Crocinitomicaceae bacterium]|nr:hypothetical protein [Crocinitomicaceae bacterium]|tara:strand:- start:7699 stop:8679 length:981 start_codon:yes stop_codon:yes gene_type:complete
MDRLRSISTRVIGLSLMAFVLATGCKKPPRASFTYDQSNGGIVQFINTSGGTIDKLTWDFGDKSAISTETNPLHRYIEAGVYRVTLTVQNADGSDVTVATITIDQGNRENLDDHPQFQDADGYYYARNILEYETSTPTVYNNIRGKAIAALYDSTNFLVSVGRVSVNGVQLTNNADNSYSFHSPDSSMYFRDEVRWVSDGGNGYPPMVENIPKSFPDLQGIIPDTFNVIIDSTYILKTAKQILFADSVIWNIETPEGTLMAQKRTLGGVAGVFFEKEDMLKIKAVGAGQTYITKVIAYSFIKKNQLFKTVYYTKESFTSSSFVTKK